MAERLIVLLPVRNASPDLSAYFTALRPLCDGIVALDDGSTDSSRRLLEAEPLVRRILTNPVRDSWQGWDDAANRNRLLEAAAALEPDWILSLDADERIDEADGAALRQFIETDALPGCAYGFQHIPMRGDASTYLPDTQWVYRLFAWEPGQRFPDQRLHFVPVPTDLPRPRWVRTTLRIQHYGGLTDAHRLERFAKYVEADPDRFFRADYGDLLAGPRPGDLRIWQARPPGQPVLLAAAESALTAGPTPEPMAPALHTGSGKERDGAPSAPGEPDEGEIPLSIVVISYNDERTIEATVNSIVDQEVSDPFEVIVVTSGTDRTAAIVQDGFPTVRLIDLPRRALPGEARNAGLRVALGTFISFPGSHVELPPGSLQARLDAHRRGYAMVTGVALNGTQTPAGWASYFIDHHAGLPGHRPARIDGPPAHCSYDRLALMGAGGFPEGTRTAEDTQVNQILVRQGHGALRDPAIRFTHRSPCRTVRKLLSHHFTRGRGWGRLMVAQAASQVTTLDMTLVRQRVLGHIPAWMHRIDRGVEQADPELADQYRPVRRLVLAGVVAAWAGMWFELLRAGPGLWRRRRDVQHLTILVAPAIGQSTVQVIRLDLTTRHAQVLVVRSDRHIDEVVDDPDPLSNSRALGIDRIETALGLAVDLVTRNQPLGSPTADDRLRTVHFRSLMPQVAFGRGSSNRLRIDRRLKTLAALTDPFHIVESSATIPVDATAGTSMARPPRTRIPGRMSQ